MKDIEKWYARKTSHGLTGVVHMIRRYEGYMVNADTFEKIERINKVYLVCNPQGHRNPDTVIKIDDISNFRECPECHKALAQEVKIRIQGERTREYR